MALEPPEVLNELRGLVRVDLATASAFLVGDRASAGVARLVRDEVALDELSQAVEQFARERIGAGYGRRFT
jgi:hypothetical protein